MRRPLVIPQPLLIVCVIALPRYFDLSDLYVHICLYVYIYNYTYMINIHTSIYISIYLYIYIYNDERRCLRGETGDKDIRAKERKSKSVHGHYLRCTVQHLSVSFSSKKQTSI